MKTFQIKRSKWARGGMNGESALLNYHGAMCCLGFYCKKLGSKENQLYGVADPAEFIGRSDIRTKTWLKKLTGLLRKKDCRHTDVARQLMLINDDDQLATEAERESKITKLFKKLGWNVKFVD